MKINLSPFFTKFILSINPFNKILVVCRGYGEDYENFTEIIWDDDRDLDFYDQESYPEFQLWVL